MEEIYKMANDLVTNWSREKENKLFSLCIELEVFASESEDGIVIEDDFFYLKRDR